MILIGTTLSPHSPCFLTSLHQPDLLYNDDNDNILSLSPLIWRHNVTLMWSRRPASTWCWLTSAAAPFQQNKHLRHFMSGPFCVYMRLYVNVSRTTTSTDLSTQLQQQWSSPSMTQGYVSYCRPAFVLLLVVLVKRGWKILCLISFCLLLSLLLAYLM